MTTIKINGKVYPAKEVTFNFMCMLEEHNVDVSELDTKPMRIAREYVAYCSGMNIERAGEEIEEHVVGGEGLADLYTVLNDKLTNSGFFHAVIAQTEQQQKAQTKKKAEK